MTCPADLRHYLRIGHRKPTDNIGRQRTSCKGRKCYVVGIIGGLVRRYRIMADASVGCEGHGGTNVHVDPQDCSGGSAKGAKVCMRRMQKQECASGLTKMYDAGR